MAQDDVVRLRIGKSVSAIRLAARAVVEGLESRTLLAAAPGLDWSSYLGGSGYDVGAAIAVDGSGNAWVAGISQSVDGAYATALVAKINADGTLAWSTNLGDDWSESYGIATNGSGDAWVAGSFSVGGGAHLVKINSDGTLAWSSWVYSRGICQAVAVDDSGNAWVTGWTAGTNRDVFVAKVNADGTVVWSTSFGGASYDYGRGIAVDGDGNAWVTGYTSSAGWVSGGFDTSYNGSQDGFVAKITSNGTLAWSSYLSPTGWGRGYGIAVDGSGNALVTGFFSGGDLAKINADGTLAWSTFAGPADGMGYGVAVDANDNVWVTGSSYGGDAFVAKVKAAGTPAWWEDIWGSTYSNYGGGIAVDGGGNAWVTGYTTSAGWASGGFDTSYNGGGDAFVAKISNPAPTVYNRSKQVNPNTSLVFTSLNFAKGFSDPESDDLRKVKITSLPSHGIIQLNDVAVTLGQEIAVGQLGMVTYTPDSDYIGTDSFGWNGSDGMRYAESAASVNLSIQERVLMPPELTWSSYLGGSGDDYANAIAKDDKGNVWVTGYTDSTDLPASAGFDTSYNDGGDAFVAKINADGTLAWSSYLGGSGYDYGYGIALDGDGNAWVTGYTESANLASNGFDTTSNGGGDAFVAKVNADGTLAWSSYLGGNGYDCGYGIAIDGGGHAWVTGNTDSANFAGGGFDTSFNGNNDAFVAKINANGTLAWSSYLGGNGYDSGYGIAVDGGGSAWVTGYTESTDLDGGGFDASYNEGGDAFVAKINAEGTLAWSSYLGGSGDDSGYGIAVDGGGNAWITGRTDSTDLASGGFDTSHNGGGYDAFVAKINANGTLGWSSYLGGNGWDIGYAIAADGDGNAWVTGETNSTDFASGGFDTVASGEDSDAFAAKINTNGTLAWSSYLGGSGDDCGYGIVVDDNGNGWVAGFTNSADFANGGFDTGYNGGNADVFVANIFEPENKAPTDIALSNTSLTENAGAGAAIGQLTVIDPNVGEPTSVELVAGEGSTDNALFQIVSGQLQAKQSFDYETEPHTRSIRVRGTDTGGLSVEKVFVITITDVNDPPTDITLSNAAVAENTAAGVVIGTLSASDQDAGETFTFSLPSGVGDNNAFAIVGNELQVKNALDFETKASYALTIQVSDHGGLSFAKVFTIGITDVDEIPPVVTRVYVRGTTWTGSFMSYLASSGVGDSTLGYAIPVGTSAQLKTLPWTNINRISVKFSEDVVLDQADLAMAGVNTASYNIAGTTFSYNSTTFVGTWQFPASFAADKLSLAVNADGASPVVDRIGNKLDGEFTTSSSVFPSGNGSAGGNFVFRINLLPGDANQNGSVSATDVTLVRNAQFKVPGNTLYTIFKDLNGSATMSATDVTLVRARQFTPWPIAEPSVPVFT